jgi:hypothetical protein
MSYNRDRRFCHITGMVMRDQWRGQEFLSSGHQSAIEKSIGQSVLKNLFPL